MDIESRPGNVESEATGRGSGHGDPGVVLRWHPYILAGLTLWLPVILALSTAGAGAAPQGAAISVYDTQTDRDRARLVRKEAAPSEALLLTM